MSSIGASFLWVYPTLAEPHVIDRYRLSYFTVKVANSAMSCGK